MEQLLIAHDLGTSGDKATLFTTKGRQIRSFTVPYDVHFFNGNYAEQDPENWWDAVCDATKAVLEGEDPSKVAAMSFSAQMQGCLVVDKNGVPLRDAIIWADQRAVEEAEQLEKKIGAKRMYEITGHRVSPSYSIEKLMWLKKHEPEVYEKTYKMLQAKDYIISRATGKFVTDYSDASGTNALDLRKLEWSEEIIKANTRIGLYRGPRGRRDWTSGRNPRSLRRRRRSLLGSRRSMYQRRRILPYLRHIRLDRRNHYGAVY